MSMGTSKGRLRRPQVVSKSLLPVTWKTCLNSAGIWAVRRLASMPCEPEIDEGQVVFGCRSRVGAGLQMPRSHDRLVVIDDLQHIDRFA